MSLARYCAALAGLLLLLLQGPARAQDVVPPAEAQEAAWLAAIKAATAGPADIPLGDQATLHLPSEFSFFPVLESTNLMKAYGNSVGGGFLGILVPKTDNQNWIITINHTAEGYVKDDDAKTWDANALLQTLKDGTEAQNKNRVEQGMKALEILGWV